MAMTTEPLNGLDTDDGSLRCGWNGLHIMSLSFRRDDGAWFAACDAPALQVVGHSREDALNKLTVKLREIFKS